MLQSLLSLTDDDIELVTVAVRRWCAESLCSIDSDKGRRALLVAVDLIQISGMRDDFDSQLACKLATSSAPANPAYQSQADHAVK